MANTAVNVNVPNQPGLIAYLYVTEVGQAAPDVAGYALVFASGIQHTFFVIDALEGVYSVIVRDALGNTVQQGTVDLKDDAGPYTVRTLYPNPSEVLENVEYGLGLTGTLHLPPSSVVMFGYEYGGDAITVVGAYRVVSQEDFFIEPMVIGDDYVSALGRQLVFEIGLTFTPARSELKFWNCDNEVVSESTSFVDLGSGIWQVTHQLLGSVTELALQEGSYRWALTVEDAGGNKATISFGDCDQGSVKWVAADKDSSNC